MGRFQIVMIVGGCALAFFGVQEARLASEASVTPQTITCADLEAKGPGSNAHVTMTDYLLCSQAYVYEAKSKSSNSWKKVWIPAVPIDGEYVRTVKGIVASTGKLDGPLPPPANIRVLVKSSKVNNEGELSTLVNSHSMTGLVTNKIESIGSKERKMLEDSYPGIDFTRCYILDHDRKPAGAGQIAAFIGGGAALALVGGGWTLVNLRRKA